MASGRNANDTVTVPGSAASKVKRTPSAVATSAAGWG